MAYGLRATYRSTDEPDISVTINTGGNYQSLQTALIISLSCPVTGNSDIPLQGAL